MTMTAHRDMRVPASGATKAAWTVALVVSIAVHVAAAAVALREREPLVQIAGGEPVTVTILGDAAEDSLSAGSEMAEVAPTETVEAETAETEDTSVPLETAEAVETADVEDAPRDLAMAQPAERTSPVTPPVTAAETAEPVAPAVSPSVAEPVEAVVLDRAIILPVPVQTAEPVEAAEPDVASAVTPTDQAETPRDKAAPVQPERETAAAVAPDTAEVVEDVPEDPNDPYNVIARLEDVPLPTPRPQYTPPPPRQARAERPAERQPQRQQQRPRQQAGSGGNAQADARRGAADGQRAGQSAQASGQGRQANAAGNAAVSNYPGQVATRLRRSLRYPAEARRQRLRGEVHVAFTVTGNGGVSGVRIARSSGHPVLDRAAIETVQRAAPFPAIPAGAGRSSWPFTVPLAFTR